ncbi:Glucose-methanol-choline (GMC) oxidoreductase:NAD binding site [Indibacter alkaliphilus LW1]|uniref:Glucose-methanol-choline (GMC) oxidoreductase:NAD binding site n=1 Tax=Indibacter alkaliphilus (strain CCUG 57479 / KCTC 22604 / LW1) TaxID=1189612 RepID=S2E113_INDAL|nr:GMC family oxidoreductase [Indibacter alkaliphilus]EOZ95778.1 Glucose-methanol-choline (GMC) oxidoreductase:NAD binding site [Indibacter alkaliphilus LW1]
MANTFDAIVIGSGISGGWAAKELCEKGLKTLVLERGRDVQHLKDYPTMTAHPWDMPHRNRIPLEDKIQNPIVNRCYAYQEDTEHFFVKDTEHPYKQEKPFDWVRGYQVGGKSLIWARQTQRWSKYDFEGPARDGFAVDWPIRYEDIDPWYSYVERFVGISGNRDGVDTLPDGEFLKPWEMNCVEKEIKDRILANYKDRYVMIGRCAHLTEPEAHHIAQGRGQCMARNQCYRGCPFGAYFSSNSSTLPAAAATGNLTIRPDSVVHSIIYDDNREKVTGVRVVDRVNKAVKEYYAKIIFLNASTLNSNLILLNSISKRFPNGLGNDNGILGKYIAFHNYRGNIGAEFEGFKDKNYFGRRPTAVMLPNFRNVKKQEMDFLRGYMSFYTAGRRGWGAQAAEAFGEGFKEKNSVPGDWTVFMMMQGETIPKAENQVKLDSLEKDQWDIPLLKIDIDYDVNDEKLLKDFLVQGSEMLEKAGCKNIRSWDTQQAPGLDIHEMGGVRMGHDPQTSLLNAWNQMHLCNNVYVTDGACMTSTGTQNPSITYMALTARAVNHAVSEFKKGNIK